jgi:hypothetical protein
MVDSWEDYAESRRNPPLLSFGGILLGLFVCCFLSADDCRLDHVSARRRHGRKKRLGLSRRVNRPDAETPISQREGRSKASHGGANLKRARQGRKVISGSYSTSEQNSTSFDDTTSSETGSARIVKMHVDSENEKTQALEDDKQEMDWKYVLTRGRY